jgi:hypothetical protein
MSIPWGSQDMLASKTAMLLICPLFEKTGVAQLLAHHNRLRDEPAQKSIHI